jgi:hypothetical protein
MQDSMQDRQDMTAQRLWALEPGFRCFAAKGGKTRIRACSLLRSALSHYFHALLFFFALMRSIFGLTLASVIAQKSVYVCL